MKHIYLFCKFISQNLLASTYWIVCNIAQCQEQCQDRVEDSEWGKESAGEKTGFLKYSIEKIQFSKLFKG